MSVNEKKQNTKKRVICYSVLTVLFTCVLVMGIFIVKTGSIFGMFSYKSPYVEGNPEDISKETIEVTSQDDYTSVLKADEETKQKYKGANALPEIPEAKRGFEKGTKENPFVILEIVPELSQQSLSYFSASKEEGLPFDPLELGMQMSKEKGKSFIIKTEEKVMDLDNKNWKFKDSTWIQDDATKAETTPGGWVKDFGGIFNSKNNEDKYNYRIYDYDKSVIGSNKKDTTGEDYDFCKAPLVVLDAYYTVEMHKDVSFLKSLSFESNGSKAPVISDLYQNNAEFKENFKDKDGKEIPQNVLEDDINWAWKIEKDTQLDKQFTVTVTDPGDAFDMDYNDLDAGIMDKKSFFEKQADFFGKADDGTDVTKEQIKNVDGWEKFELQEEKKGYFVYVGAGNGNLKITSEQGILYEQGGGWKYIENQAELPENSEDVWPVGKSESDILSDVNNKFNSPVDGCYFSVSSPWSSIPSVIKNGEEVIYTIKTSKKYIFNYKYNGYKISFQYIGLKWNDILKRMLFNFKDEKDSTGKVIKTADQQYNEYYMKLIVVTPDMINAMDKNDTKETLNYIERADLFYVSSYYRKDGNVDGYKNTRDLFFKYVDPQKDTILSSHKNKEDTLANFEENDLEWVDVMKIIKRLSGDTGLPMMYSKQMGDYFGDNGESITHNLYDDIKVGSSKNSLCNLAKMYLVTLSFDLSADANVSDKDDLIWSFMDNVYDSIQQIKITNNNKSSSNTAIYTGYFSQQKDIDKTAYLWDLMTFIPNIPSDNENAIFTKGEYKGNTNTDNARHIMVKKYGFLASSFTAIYPEDIYGTLENDNNLSNNGFKQMGNGAGSVNYAYLTGTRDPLQDYQNVTVAMAIDTIVNDEAVVTYDMGKKGQGVPGTFLYASNSGNSKYKNVEKYDNPNMSIIEGGVMSNMAAILSNILRNGKVPTPTMIFNVNPAKKYYQKMSNTNILIDYNRSADYNEQRSKNKNLLKLYCSLNNGGNKENSIITSVTMVDPNDNTKQPINIKTIYNMDDKLIPWETDIGFSEVLPLPKKYDQEYISGYKITSNDTAYNFVVPFKLSDWKKGYTQIRIEWVARTSGKKKGVYTPYQNPSNPTDKDIVDAAKQFAEVDIGERELFNLE